MTIKAKKKEWTKQIEQQNQEKDQDYNQWIEQNKQIYGRKVQQQDISTRKRQEIEEVTQRLQTQQNEEQAKQDIRTLFLLTGKIILPNYTNYGGTVILEETSQRKETITMAFPEYQVKRNGNLNRKGLRFLDEPKIGKLTEIPDKQCKKTVYRATTTINQQQYELLLEERPQYKRIFIQGTILNPVTKIENTPLKKDYNTILVQNSKKQEINKQELITTLENLNTMPKITQNIFGHLTQPETYQQAHAALFYSAKIDNYPLQWMEADFEHMGGNIGKTHKIKRLQKVFQCNEYLDLGESTIKGLGISHYNDKKENSFLERQNGLALIDEWCELIDLRPGEWQRFGETLKGAWVHSAGTSESGTTTKKPIWNFRAYMSGNIPDKIPDIESLLLRIDPNFLARNNFYIYTKEHINYIRQNEAKIANHEANLKEQETDWRQPKIYMGELHNYIWELEVIFNENEFQQIKETQDKLRNRIQDQAITPILEGTVKKAWDKRSLHRFRCTLDGLTKIQNNTEIIKHIENNPEKKTIRLPLTEQSLKKAKEIEEMIQDSWLTREAD